MTMAVACRQVNEYVERELANHRQLIHPHIIQFKEVPPALPMAICHSASVPVTAPSHAR